MTEAGQPSPAPDPVSSPGRVRRAVMAAGRVVIWLVLLCITLPAVLLLGLTVRLSAGPLDVTPVVSLLMPLPVAHGLRHQDIIGSLSAGHVRMGWNAVHEGLRAPLVIWVEDVRIQRRDGQVADTLRRGRLTLDSPALFHGSVRILELSASHGRLKLARNSQGKFGLDLGPDTPYPSTKPEEPAPVDLTALRQAVISDTHVNFADRMTGRTWRLGEADARLKVVTESGQKGITGDVRLGLEGNGERLVVHGTGDRVGPGQVNWTLQLDPISPAAFAPGQKEVEPLGLPVGGQLQVAFRNGGRDMPFLMPRDFTLHLNAGNGKVTTRKAGQFLVGEGEADLVGALGPGPGNAPFDGPLHVMLKRLELHLRAPGHATDDGSGPTLDATADLKSASLLHPKAVALNVAARARSLDFATLGDFWPPRAMKGARRWVTQNIPEGHVQELQVNMGLSSHRGWDGLDLVSLGGTIDADHMELHWLRPIPPMHDMDAHLTFDGPDEIMIRFGHAYQLVDLANRHVDATGTGRIEVGPGSMRITGLNEKVQLGDINVTLLGNARDVLALLAEPRLNVLSRHPMSFTHPEGRANVSLHIALPLDAHVRLDQIDLRSHTDLGRVHLGNVVVGRPLDNGNLGIDATINGLLLQGTGVLAGIPSSVIYTMDFRSGPMVHAVESASLQGHVTPEGVRRAGFEMGEHFSGSAQLDVDYDRYVGGRAQVDIDLDLDRAALAIPIWSKKVGQEANASVELDLDHGQISSIENIRAVGPDLLIDGHAETASGVARRLILRGFHVGRSMGNASVTLPVRDSDPIGVNVAAKVLDLSPLVSFQTARDDTASAKVASQQGSSGYHVPEMASGRVKGPPGRRWDLNVDARTLYYSPKDTLTNVHSHLETNGVRLTRGVMTVEGPVAAEAHLTPQGNTRVLDVHVASLGTLLQDMKVTDEMQGGVTDITGSFDDSVATAPFSGKVHMGPFVLRNVPAVVRMANNASIYGWLAAPHAPSFQVEQLDAPVTLDEGNIHIADGLVSNASLGATVSGDVNLEKKTLNLDGTIIPAFAVNAAPGHLPGLLGWLFSPEKNGGVVSATYQVTGPMDNPAVHVNPYAMLLPGFLRNLMHIH
ncbi:AsmA-like C-terminal region-containing protein [Komagataeibacter oboediens]